jgi:soluble lytic murein transglycosylase
MRLVRMNAPEPPDSSALKNYPIYEYLVAARLLRDLTWSLSDAVDSAIDGFLQTHAAEVVTRTLRHQWLSSLAQRRRWDWFLPRSVDVSDPQLICDRLTGRLATGDT